MCRQVGDRCGEKNTLTGIDKVPKTLTTVTHGQCCAELKCVQFNCVPHSASKVLYIPSSV